MARLFVLRGAVSLVVALAAFVSVAAAVPESFLIGTISAGETETSTAAVNVSKLRRLAEEGQEGPGATVAENILDSWGYYDAYTGEFKCRTGYTKSVFTDSCYGCGGSVRRRRATLCTDCQPGFYNDYQQDNCLRCEGGVTRRRRSNKCSDCGAGHYDDEDHDNCMACSGGEARRRRATQCTDCRPGFYDAGHHDDCRRCTDGQVRRRRADSCTACQSGYWDDDSLEDQDDCITATTTATTTTSSTDTSTSPHTTTATTTVSATSTTTPHTTTATTVSTVTTTAHTTSATSATPAPAPPPPAGDLGSTAMVDGSMRYPRGVWPVTVLVVVLMAPME